MQELYQPLVTRKFADDYGYDAKLLKAAVEVNQNQRYLAIAKLQQTLRILKGKTIGLLGLTFKPDTDDQCPRTSWI
jgi:UDPglucose 6-dehydrogenase